MAGLLASTGPANSAFPGANGKIAYVKVTDRGAGEIWAMNPDGSDQKNISGPKGFLDAEPVWSADGSKIAFTSKRSGEYNIWVMNADGTGATNITKDQTEDAPASPTWSADGTKIAFSARTAGGANREIYFINADGSGLVQLTNTPVADPGGYESDPTFSPDGTKLAFVDGYSCGGGRGIFVMNIDGSNRIRVVAGGSTTNCVTHPAWSPDGAKIAFMNGGAISIVNADGTSLTSPTNVATSVRTFNGAAWSPDGAKLAFANEQGNISVIGIDGTGEQELTVNADNEQMPDWAVVAPAVAPPSPGKSGNVRAVSGKVCVVLPRAKRCTPIEELASIPVGTVIDTTRGAVELTTAADAKGKTQTGTFSGGRFLFDQVHEKRKRKLAGGTQTVRVLVTLLALRGGGNPSTCGAGVSGRGVLGTAAKRRFTRYINAKAHGRFRVRGRRSSGVERGTAWTTKDDCKGTLTTVTQGAVLVTDFAKRQPILVKAPGSYLATGKR